MSSNGGGTTNSNNVDNKEEEAKFVQAFKDIQMSKGFYFSYTYDITHSLQYNVLRNVNKQREKGKQQFQDATLQKHVSEMLFDPALAESKSVELVTEPNEDIDNVHTDHIKNSIGPSKRKKDLYSWDEKFVWNFYLLQDLLSLIKFKKWILPVVHGYINVLSKEALSC